MGNTSYNAFCKIVFAWPWNVCAGVGYRSPLLPQSTPPGISSFLKRKEKYKRPLLPFSSLEPSLGLTDSVQTLQSCQHWSSSVSRLPLHPHLKGTDIALSLTMSSPLPDPPCPKSPPHGPECFGRETATGVSLGSRVPEFKRFYS